LPFTPVNILLPYKRQCPIDCEEYQKTGFFLLSLWRGIVSPADRVKQFAVFFFTDLGEKTDEYHSPNILMAPFMNALCSYRPGTLGDLLKIAEYL
jgi:hypothetical protein